MPFNSPFRNSVKNASPFRCNFGAVITKIHNYEMELT